MARSQEAEKPARQEDQRRSWHYTSYSWDDWLVSPKEFSGTITELLIGLLALSFLLLWIFNGVNLMLQGEGSGDYGLVRPLPGRNCSSLLLKYREAVWGYPHPKPVCSRPPILQTGFFASSPLCSAEGMLQHI